LFWISSLAAGPLRRRAGFDPMPVHVRVLIDKLALRQYSPVCDTPPVLLILLYLSTVIRRTSGRSLGNFR